MSDSADRRASETRQMKARGDLLTHLGAGRMAATGFEYDLAAGSADRYAQGERESRKFVPEGVEGAVPYRGSLSDLVYQFVGGLRSTMGYCGCGTIDEMRTRPEFVRVTSAGMSESHVHDVSITKEAPNYPVR